MSLRRIEKALARDLALLRKVGILSILHIVQYHLNNIAGKTSSVMLLPNGLRAYINANIADDLLHSIDEVFVLQEYSLLSDYVPRRNDIIVDAGAFYGIYTLFSAKKARKVLAFEPQLDVLSYLLLNINLNKLEGVVIALPYALSNTTERAKFYVHERKSRSSLCWVSEKMEITSVPTITIDKIVSDFKLSNINVLKIDVEGAELSLLQGAQRALSEHVIEKIVMEVHPWLIDCRSIISLLKKHGFVVDYIASYEGFPTKFLYARSKR
ncbi:MAG: FkbM family methyltransferase [Candidatus Nezhaarchaeota archaeon]|nr:FkbM family methyltransferase [Candidatus Nezhaarchaeota archaeon]